MRNCKLINVCLFACLFTGGFAFGQKPPKNSSHPPFGINLAGAEFGHGSKMPGQVNVDYFYPTVEDLDYWQSKHLLLLRVPFKWERIQHKTFGALTLAEVEEMKRLLSEAGQRGMKVLLDLHNYGRRKVGGVDYIIGHDSLAIEAFSSFWGQLAVALKGFEPCIYGYGLMNEPHDMLPSVPWVKIAQAAIFEIRRYDRTTPVIVGGNHWSSADRWLEVSDELKYLYDPVYRLIFEAHVYFDKDGSGVYRRSYDEEEANPYIGIERARPFAKWLETNNQQGLIGEYGVPSDDVRWLDCLDIFLDYLHQRNIGTAYWAAGARWNNYILSAHPKHHYTVDMPQVGILERHSGGRKN
jgi:endoglucanase